MKRPVLTIRDITAGVADRPQGRPAGMVAAAAGRQAGSKVVVGGEEEGDQSKGAQGMGTALQ